MSFLTLNGATIPVAAYREDVEEIGERGRVFGGGHGLSRRESKRKWEVSTPPIAKISAERIKHIILGSGQRWPCESDAFSTRGLGTAATSVVTYRQTLSSSGLKSVLDENSKTEAKYGTSSTAVEPGTTNMLAADARDAENAPTGYTSVGGAILGAGTTYRWQGSKCLRIESYSSGDGAYAGCNPGAGSSGKTYYGTVYLKRLAIVPTINVYLRDNTNGADGTPTQITPTDTGWYRVSCQITISGSDCTDLRLTVKCISSGAIIFLADGFQVEEGTASINKATSWVDGTRASGTFKVDSSIITGSGDFTFAAWVKQSTVNPPADAMVFEARSSKGESLTLYRQSGANNLVFATHNASTDTIIKTSAWDNDWHNVLVAYRANPGAGESRKTLAFDGSVVGTSNPSSYPNTANMESFSIGCSHEVSPSAWLCGQIEDAIYLPYAVEDSWITTYYALGRHFTNLPVCEIDGDIVSNYLRYVIGEVRSIDNKAFHDGSAWRNNGCVLKLLLHEV